MKKVISILLVALLCCCTFVSTVAPVVYAENGDSFFNSLTDISQVSDDKLNELVGSYVDFYQDLGSGDILGALTTGAVDIPLDWLGFAGQSLIETADACNVTGVSPSTLVMAADKLKNDSDLMYMVSDVGELLVYDGVNKLIRPVEATDVPKIDGSTFKELCNEYSSTYCPKNTKDFITWRTDKRFSEVDDYLSAPRLSFFTDGYFCGEDTWTECFLVPWYTDGTSNYFSQYQFHFYQIFSEDDNGNRVITMYCDLWDMINGGDVQTITISNQILDYRYIDFCVSTENGRLSMTPYASYTDYINRTRRLSLVEYFTMTDNVGKNIAYSSDRLTTVNINDYLSCWQKAVSAHDDGECTVGDLHDTGYYVSNKPIAMDLTSVDFTKFADDDTVTLKGDTIYDYTITNKDGDTTTINNYITNNYTYPVTDTGDSGEEDSGTSTGGSGDVNVNVDVDVNNNIADGFIPVDVNLDNYLEQTPEQAKPLTEFFSIFFEFLPPELLRLLCLGLVVCIILRVWGR